MEADWKTFRDMVPMLRERYVAAQNARVIRVLTEPNKADIDRFWDALELMQVEAKTLRRCLDGHSRSKMTEFMHSMLAVGMLKKEELTKFSPEIQAQMGRFAFDRE